MPTLFDVCVPRDDVLRGAIQESDFAADLAQVLRGEGPKEILDPVQFFANTHPTVGLRNLLKNVCLRLSASGREASSIFRLDTQYGGGKTHALIALSHIVHSPTGIANLSEFVEPSDLPRGTVRVAAFDGENADPASGHELEPGLRAFTPWGEIAYRLAGTKGFEAIKANDEQGVAPGADNLRALFGGEPSLILLDELALYLRAVKGLPVADQLTRFLTNLFKAVEGTPNAAIVYTLAIGKGGAATDAYGDEHKFIADKMAEAESVSARKATLLDPTAEDETAQVIRRRLFKSIDDAAAAPIIDAYRDIWNTHREILPPERTDENRIERLRLGYPLHPELMAALTDKMATYGNFQRVRGMLRLLARSVELVWNTRPANTYALHLHHLDPGYDPIKNEIVTRLTLPLMDNPIRNDVSNHEGSKASLAQEFDRTAYAGLPPYGSIVARPILFHTLAVNDANRGLNDRELRYSALAPALDPSFIDDARKRFVEHSAFLDDRPHAPLRFLTEANLTQVIRRQEGQVDPGEARNYLNDTIKRIFADAVMNMVPFAANPGDVPDDSGDGKPYLVVVGCDADDVRADALVLPPLVERIYRHKGAAGSEFRQNRNNLVFVVIDAARKDDMRKKAVTRLALDQLRRPDQMAELQDHQQERVKELFQRSEQELAIAIQQAYRHLFFPSRNRMEGAAEDIAHSVIDTQSASEAPGAGQKAIVRLLRDLNKLRMEDDPPDSPVFIRERTPLRKGSITTADLRAEFRKDPALPILVADGVFVRAIRQGIDQREFVYRSGELICGQGDPQAAIDVDEQSFVYTVAYAQENGIWPPKKPDPKPGPDTEHPASPGAPMGGENDQLPGGFTGPTEPGSAETADEQDPDITAEGVLREALTLLWEQARSSHIDAIESLTLRLFDVVEGFRLLGAVNAVSGATKTVVIEGGYQATEGGVMDFTFTGPVSDAQSVKDFLEPELRAATDKSIDLSYRIDFPDGLAMAGDAAEKLTERLARFTSGEAHVTATAKPRPPEEVPKE
jgi:hypothetical protein